MSNRSWITLLVLLALVGRPALATPTAFKNVKNGVIQAGLPS